MTWTHDMEDRDEAARKLRTWKNSLESLGACCLHTNRLTARAPFPKDSSFILCFCYIESYVLQILLCLLCFEV